MFVDDFMFLFGYFQLCCLCLFCLLFLLVVSGFVLLLCLCFVVFYSIVGGAFEW